VLNECVGYDLEASVTQKSSLCWDRGLRATSCVGEIEEWGNSQADSISQHSDKTLDIAHGTPIVNVSFGASRLFTLRSKAKLRAGTGAVEVQRITLPHNSAFVLDLPSNAAFTHQISADSRAPGQRRSDETAYGGTCGFPFFVFLFFSFLLICCFKKTSKNKSLFIKCGCFFPTCMCGPIFFRADETVAVLC
jgi:hypothetical protein